MSKITVIGAGLMGHGIALVFARHGHEVTVQDPDEKPWRLCTNASSNLCLICKYLLMRYPRYSKV